MAELPLVVEAKLREERAAAQRARETLAAAAAQGAAARFERLESELVPACRSFSRLYFKLHLTAAASLGCTSSYT